MTKDRPTPHVEAATRMPRVQDYGQAVVVLRQYLERELEDPRVCIEAKHKPDGRVRFYIHPTDVMARQWLPDLIQNLATRGGPVLEYVPTEGKVVYANDAAFIAGMERLVAREAEQGAAR